ncbi:MAG: hypothetical protein WHT82_11725, partial [Limisphaera sp.]
MDHWIRKKALEPPIVGSGCQAWKSFDEPEATIRLRPETQLIGTHRCFTWLQPTAAPGGDFTDPQNPRPVVETADDSEAVT